MLENDWSMMNWWFFVAHPPVLASSNSHVHENPYMGTEVGTGKSSTALVGTSSRTSWNWGEPHHRFPVSKLRSDWFFRSYENQDEQKSGWWFFATLLKNDGVKVSWDDEIPNIWKKCSKPPIRDALYKKKQ